MFAFNLGGAVAVAVAVILDVFGVMPDNALGVGAISAAVGVIAYILMRESPDKEPRRGA